jgi:glutathione S-transferase
MSTSNLTLFYIPFSPWSLKARFVLHHHGIGVDARVYAPVLDELRMRVRLRKPRGRITVPVLFTPEGTLTDSWQIANYAERVGKGTPLLPAAGLSEIEAWNSASERLLSAGRARSMVRATGDLDAVIETLPEPVKKYAFVAAPVGRVGVRLFNRKYGIRANDVLLHESTMRLELDHLRQALAGGRRYLLGAFSYADVTMALALQVLEPLPETPLGPRSRAAGTDDVLKRSYADLLRWRDDIHTAHRLVHASNPSAQTAVGSASIAT